MSLISRRKMIRQTAAGLMLPMFVPRWVLGGDGKPGANERLASVPSVSEIEPVCCWNNSPKAGESLR